MNTKSKKSYAVITGASSGIGEAFAKQLAKEGYSLILIARRIDRLNIIKKKLEKYMAPETICITYQMDVTNTESCYEFMNFMQDHKIGIFINNAGFGDCNYFPDGSLDKEIEMIDVNVRALHFLTKLVIKKMCAQRYGYLLNVASSAGLMPAGPYMATYYATKAYVTSFTRAISKELSEHEPNIYVGCLCPGPVKTEFNSIANVEFSLPGISADKCAKIAVAEMKKRTTVIIPTYTMKAASMLCHIAPADLAISVIGALQKKKMYKA